MKNLLNDLNKYTLKEMLYIEDLNEVQWIWFNYDTLKDVFINVSLYDEREIEIEEFIKNNNFNEMESYFDDIFKYNGFEKMDQNLFASLVEGFKVTKDIETIIYVNKGYYRKLYIKIMLEYNWMLKAMAIDTYKSIFRDYKTIKSTYEELFEDNSRILEEILSSGEYEFMSGRWKIDRKTNMLKFFKGKKFYNSWGKGEVNSVFKDNLC